MVRICLPIWSTAGHLCAGALATLTCLTAPAMAQEPVVVDLLILYTPAVAASEGGTAATQALAAERMGEVNQIFSRSGTNTQVRLVAAVEVPYVESGDMSTDFGRLNQRADGYLDDLDSLRSAHEADLVMLIIDTAAPAGPSGMAGFQPPPSLKTRDTFTAIVLGFRYLTMAHELGHLFGLSHFNTESELSDLAGPADSLKTPTYAAGEFGFGYGPLGGTFHTALCSTLATDLSGGSTGLARFSNASMTERGATLGHPELADEARAIREAAPMLAAYSETSCHYAVSPELPVNETAVVSDSGQSFSFTITTAVECLTGVRVPDQRWITVHDARALDAKGSGAITFTVQPNTSSRARAAMVVMGRSRLRVNQGGQCAELVADKSIVRVPASVNGTNMVEFPIGMKRPGACSSGSPTVSASWLRVFELLTSTTGDERLDFLGRADVNMTPLEREAQVSLGSVSVKVIQEAGLACSVNMPGFVVLNAGGAGNVSWGLGGDVTGCVTSASTTTPWLSFPEGTSLPLGRGFIGLQAQLNDTGSTRAGSVTVNGREIQIYQRAISTSDCGYGTSFPQGIPAAGGTVPFAITTSPGCRWAVRSDSSFMSVVPGTATGVGSGQVSMTFAPNPGGPRHGRFGVHTHASFEQPGLTSCQPGFVPPPSVPSAGGVGGIDITSSCQWTVSMRTPSPFRTWAPYFTFLSPRLGYGSGRLEFSMPANDGYTREIRLEIRSGAATAVATVTQPGPLGINPGCRASGSYRLTAPARGDSFRLRDFAPVGCRAFTTTGVLEAGLSLSVVGNAIEDLMVFVAPNETTAARTLTAAVNGATIRVEQATAMTCRYVVPPVVSIGNTTLARVPVLVLPGCAWSASTTAPWLTGASTGTGSGTAEFAVVSKPPGLARAATVTVAGQTVTILDTGDPLTGSSPTDTEAVAIGESVSVLPTTTSGQASLSFFNVTAPGTVTLTELAQAPEALAAAPAGLSFLPGRMLEINTTAAFDSLVVCVRVSMAETMGAGLLPTSLRMLHKPASSTEWMDVTYSLDASIGLLCGHVSSLSPFAIGGTAFPYTRFLSEGATSDFFDTRIALLNPRNESNIANLTFQRAGRSPYVHSVAMPPRTRVTIDPKALVGFGSAEFSTTITSVGPLVVDRTMTWDPAQRYGSHAETAVVRPSTTWYLAEGSTNGGFELFYLLQNPAHTPTSVRVRYLRGGGTPLEKTYVLAPRSRTNIWVNVEEFPGVGQVLADADVSGVIESLDDTPIIVERAMYLTSQGRTFNAGHESAGVTAPALSWFLAEGATGPFFDLFVLVANPNAQDAEVRVEYLLGDGRTFTRTMLAPANSRSNIWVDHESFDGGATFPLADVAVSTTLTATNGVPIIVERAMWWPGNFTTWYEGHNSAGSVVTGTKWALAEGEAGGSQRAETYVLVANVSPTPGMARVTLMFEDGSSLVKDYPLTPNSRTNVAVGPDFGAAVNGRRFGVVVESIGTAPAQIVVERAMYGGATGPQWSAGTNALATRLR
jgi:hypothetical protein